MFSIFRITGAMSQRVAVLLVFLIAAVVLEQRDVPSCDPHPRLAQCHGPDGAGDLASSPSLLAAEDVEDDLDDALPHGLTIDPRRLRHRQSTRASGLVSPLSLEPLHRPPIG